LRLGIAAKASTPHQRYGYYLANKKIQIFRELKSVFTLARHDAGSRLSGIRVSDRVPK
jgi:hypothetical protein